MKNKKEIAITNNYCNVLTQYIRYIPFVHSIIDYNDELEMIFTIKMH